MHLLIAYTYNLQKKNEDEKEVTLMQSGMSEAAKHILILIDSDTPT